MAKKATPEKKRQGTLQVEVLTVCDGVSRDPNTGKATLYGLFDKITLEAFPAKGSFWIYAKLVGQGTHTVTLDVLDPRGTRLLPQPVGTSLTIGKDGKAVFAVRADELPFERPGEYKIVIESGNRVLGRPLAIVLEKKRGKQ